jgi:uncharacterized protein (TIGR03083 family)
VTDPVAIDQPEFTAGYRATKVRIVELVGALPADDWSRTVPACPDWTVRDLLAHMVGISAELSAGRYPTGELADWLAELVTSRRDATVDALLAEWTTAVDDAEPMYTPNGLLFVDLVVHEHDLRRAVDQPGARDSAQVTRVLPLVLASLAEPLRAAGLGAVIVVDGRSTWRSHDAPAGWTIEASAWEAMRMLESRRTADELTARAGPGVEPYLDVLRAHLPLPVESLAE